MNDIIFNERNKNIVNELSNEDAGMLLKHIYAYIHGEHLEDVSECEYIAFTAIRYDIDKYLEFKERVAEKNRKNGAKGGRPSKKEKKNEKSVCVGRYDKGNYYITQDSEIHCNQLEKEILYKEN